MSDIERTAELCPDPGQPQDAIEKVPELDRAVRRHLSYEPSTGRLCWLKRAGGRTVSGQEAAAAYANASARLFGQFGRAV